MIKHGSILDSSIVENNGYVYFIGGNKGNYITRVATSDFVSYFKDYNELEDEIVAEFKENITLTSSITNGKYIYIIGGAYIDRTSDSDYVYDIENKTLRKLNHKHPGEPCRMNLYKVRHGNDYFLYSFTGFNYYHNYKVYYTKILDGELDKWRKGIMEIKYIRGSIVHYNYVTNVFELYGGKDSLNNVVALYRETNEPFIEVFYANDLEIGPIADSFYSVYRDGFIIAGGVFGKNKRTSIIYYVKRNEYTGENEYIHIGNLKEPLSDLNALLIDDTLYVLSGYNDDGLAIESLESIKLNV